MKIVSDNTTVSMERTKTEYTILCENPIQPFKITIPTSIVMDEWNVAICPVLYRSIRSNKVIIHNYTVCDLDSNVWYRINKPWQHFQLDEENFSDIAHRLTIPSDYIPEICGPLEIDKPMDMTIARIIEKWNNIPTSIDASKWRYLSTSAAIAREEIWKFMPAITFPTEVGRMSVTSLRFALRRFYAHNIEYRNSEIKEEIIKRKVILPIHAPTLIQNNPLCMTSTQQSDKAGATAEIPIGTEIDAKGYITKTPEHSISTTTAQCGFPCRMAATREVVLRAISQAMWLRNAEEPLVKSEYVH